MADVPDLAAIKSYLTTNASDATIQDALDAEFQAQANRCDSDGYPDDLAQALKRRVQRNLEMRGHTLAIIDGGDVPTRIGGVDPEIRRLEAPYRKLEAL